MQAPFDLPADLDTPVSAYLKLAPLQPRFLLESAAGPERAARYSFLGFGEADRIALDAHGLTRNETLLGRPRDREQLLTLLRRALAEAPVLGAGAGAGDAGDAGAEAKIPFRGGLVGVLGFEMARRFEGRAPVRTNGRPELQLLAPHSVLVFDHQRRAAALLTADQGAGRAALRREVRRCLAGPLPEPAKARSTSAPRVALSRTEYLRRAARAQEAILDGEVYQLVLSSAFEGETELTPLELYRALRLVNPSPYMTLFEFDGEAVIGASPEALVRLENGRATLQPIAGTRPRRADPALDRAMETELLADEKEAAEHVMLVDLARNDLGRVAQPGSVKVEPYRTVERYSHVMHLVSGVQGTLEAGRDAFDCLAACFPAGTVVGAPKLRALQWIHELEPEPRGLYAGTAGYFGHGGTMAQALSIRTLFLSGGSYRYQAGAGIVADSTPEAEYDEILAKGAALGEALALAAEGL